MKEAVLILFVSALSLVSCQKTYICDCEETYEADNYHGSYSEDILASKKNKQSKCDSYMRSNYQQYTGSTFSCTVN
jgi:hypothetical protein